MKKNTRSPVSSLSVPTNLAGFLPVHCSAACTILWMTTSVHCSVLGAGGNKNLLKTAAWWGGNKGKQVSPKYIYKLENQMTWKT